MTYTPEDTVNVLLGYSPESVKMLEKTGAELHIFAERYSLPCLLLSNAHFHKVSFDFVPILSMHLIELAARKKNKLMFLSATGKYRELLCELKEHVEFRYIIKDQV